MDEMTKLQAILEQERAWRQEADKLLDAMVCRYAQALAQIRTLQRQLAVRDELDRLEAAI